MELFRWTQPFKVAKPLSEKGREKSGRKLSMLLLFSLQMAFKCATVCFQEKKWYNIINIGEIKGAFNFNTLHSKPLKTQLCTHHALVRLNLTRFLGFNPILGSTFRFKKSDWPQKGFKCRFNPIMYFINKAVLSVRKQLT